MPPGKPIAFLALAALALLAPTATAHCDAVDGPVASAAIRALDEENPFLVFPFVKPEAEGELQAAYEDALDARATGPAAKTVADRYFMETAVRLHREGEDAPYSGLQPAGSGRTPAVEAAEEALESGDVGPLVALLADAVERETRARFEAASSGAAEPRSAEDVAAARERVERELEFIGYAEGVHRAALGTGGAHERGEAAAAECPPVSP